MADADIKATRHFAATRLTRDLGAVVAASIVGHADPSMTQRVYAHAVDEDRSAAAHTLAEGLPGVG